MRVCGVGMNEVTQEEVGQRLLVQNGDVDLLSLTTVSCGTLYKEAVKDVTAKTILNPQPVR